MAGLMGGPEKIPQIVADLQGVIYKDPATGPFDMEAGGDGWSRGWQTADEYLSGNVREKLAQARAAAEEYHEFAINVESLEQVQPKELTAAEIEVRVGVDWIDPKYYQQFLFELLQIPAHLQNGKIQVRYLSLGGTAPNALLQFLRDHPAVAQVSLCLDNDKAGLIGMDRLEQAIQADPVLAAQVTLLCRNPPPAGCGKDYNEFLTALVRMERGQQRGREAR